MSLTIGKRFADCMFALTTVSQSESLTESHLAAIAELAVRRDNIQLDDALRKTPDPIIESGQLVPLPRLGAEWIPLVHVMRGQLPDGREFITLSIVLAGEKDGEHRSLGWRFEAPEGSGEHCYWHAQPIREVRRQGDAIPLATPDWLPDTMPAIPLAASDPMQLLVCALVSIYGHATLADMAEMDCEDDLAEELAALAHSTVGT